MSIFAQAPEPPTELGRMRTLAKHASIRVSPLQLRAMSIGQAWNQFMGSMDKEASFKLLDAFVEAGGNFIDTANNYQDEESEKWIGEWVKARKNRDLLVIATKYVFVPAKSPCPHCSAAFVLPTRSPADTEFRICQVYHPLQKLGAWQREDCQLLWKSQEELASLDPRLPGEASD